MSNPNLNHTVIPRLRDPAQEGTMNYGGPLVRIDGEDLAYHVEPMVAKAWEDFYRDYLGPAMGLEPCEGGVTALARSGRRRWRMTIDVDADQGWVVVRDRVGEVVSTPVQAPDFVDIGGNG